MIEFTVSKIKVEPCGSDLHLFINEPLSTLIEQLCEDGYVRQISEAVAAWWAKQVEPCT